MYTEAYKWIWIEQQTHHGLYIFYPLKINVRVYFNNKTVRTFKSYIYSLLTCREYNDNTTSLEELKDMRNTEKIKNLYCSYNGPKNCSTFTCKIRLAHRLLLVLSSKNLELLFINLWPWAESNIFFERDRQSNMIIFLYVMIIHVPKQNASQRIIIWTAKQKKRWNESS